MRDYIDPDSAKKPVNENTDISHDIPSVDQVSAYMQEQSATVPLEMAGQRLDRVLVQLFPAFTRARLQVWLEGGRVMINGVAATKASGKVQAGQLMLVKPEAPPHMQAMLPEPVELDVVFENNDCIVINKPAGMVVHPAAGNWSGTLLNGLLYRWPSLSQLPRAGIVHRLDKETSGLMVVGKHIRAQERLVAQLQARTVRRLYLAVVWGRVSRQVTVDAKIGRDPRSRVKMAVVGSGKQSVTHFFPLAHGTVDRIPVTLMACKLETGRTHQIRVHALHAGFGLLGDPVYRQAKTPEVPFIRQALHATQLSFADPSVANWKKAATLAFEVPPPHDMLTFMAQMGLPTDLAEYMARLAEIWPSALPPEDEEEPFELQEVYYIDDEFDESDDE